MENEKVLALLEKYHQGLCTEEESAIVEAWYNGYAAEHSAEVIDEDLEMEKAMIWKNVQENKNPVKTVRLNYSKWAAIAATIVVIVTAGLLFFTNKPKSRMLAAVVKSDMVKPGKYSATLTLANGKRISLSDATSGELANEAGVAISKTADGKLIYEIQNQTGAANKINTISTDKGETYQLRLPDGTNIWLNAASSLTYATTLIKDGIRNVKLEGEAYFEVAKDKKHPFIVETSKQQVEVLGTHFNINAYADEAITKTTLLEGSVLLNRATLLKPDEQASLSSTGKISVEQVDVQETIAWKNGKFIFNSEDITSVMRKLSRWYNVEVVYKSDSPVSTFTGVMNRDDDISKILNKINYTGGAHLTLEGRRIVVMP
ncbi:FecR family protein [Pedobacter psychrodurus]|uniref:FecR family protein n=1 Tax=Pedobacter psychrodurus TaxID=2530456 RepID=UPI00292D1230|nr:FecR family protein [Pedobacter psychrodurus]